MLEGKGSAAQRSMIWRLPGRSQQTYTSSAACCWPRKRRDFQHHVSVVLKAPLRQGGVSFLCFFGLPGASGDTDKKPGVYLLWLCFEERRQSQLQPRNNMLMQYLCCGLWHINTVVHPSPLLSIFLYSTLNQKEQKSHNRGILYS